MRKFWVRASAAGLLVGLLVGCPRLNDQSRSVSQLADKNPYLKHALVEQLTKLEGNQNTFFVSSEEELLSPMDMGEVEMTSNDQSEWTFAPDQHAAIALNATTQDPDNSLDIYNRQDDSHVERLTFCGTPCDYVGAYWLDNEHFALVQISEFYPEASSEPDGYVLIVSEYDLDQGRVIHYRSARLGPEAVNGVSVR